MSYTAIHECRTKLVLLTGKSLANCFETRHTEMLFITNTIMEITYHNKCTENIDHFAGNM